MVFALLHAARLVKPLLAASLRHDVDQRVVPVLANVTCSYIPAGVSMASRLGVNGCLQLCLHVQQVLQDVPAAVAAGASRPGGVSGRPLAFYVADSGWRQQLAECHCCCCYAYASLQSKCVPR
jgi:hypothetical protein